MRALVLTTELGLVVAGTLVACVMAGAAIDRARGGGGGFTVAFLILGVGGGLAVAYKMLSRFLSELPDEEDDE